MKKKFHHDGNKVSTTMKPVKLLAQIKINRQAKT